MRRLAAPALQIALAVPLAGQTVEARATVPAGRGSTSVAVTTDPEQAKAWNAAAERGLRWLADRQQATGCWTGTVGHKMQNDYVELQNSLPVELQRMNGAGHLGVTALAGMAFLAGGHLPDRGIFRAEVQRTIDYMIAHARENGFLTDAGTRMYSHAFATLFLAEVYGMAGGKPVKDTLERAINLIVDCQNAYGGWRYNPFDREVDLSVTVCQVQALRAARNIGIRVPEDTIGRAIDYVQKSRVKSTSRYAGLFYYKIYGRGAYDKPSEFAINAAALTALSSAGIYDADLSDAALTFLEREYADVADYYAQHYFYWYGNYYACQAFFQTGGERFHRFYARLAGDLLAAQQPDGRWVGGVGPGDEFSTAVACVLLQLPKQYLPIFQR
jgi:hypothetical protein